MKKCRMFGVLTLALLMTGSLSLTAYAASDRFGPGVTEDRPSDMEEEKWAALQDSTLRWEEIEDLIVNFSPTYLNVKYQIQANYEPYEEAAEGLHAAAREAMNDIRDARDQGNMVSELTETALRSADVSTAKAFDKVVKTIKSSTKSTMNQVRKNLVSGVQQMLFGYWQLCAAEDLLNTAVELTEASWQSTVTQAGLGMATALDVENAKQSLLSMQQSRDSVSNNILKLKQSINTMIGREADAELIIGEVPAPDLTRIESMDPEQDLDAAINNNYTYIAARKNHVDNYSEKLARNRTLDEEEQKIKVQLEADYQSVLQARTAYEAASSAYEAAQRDWEANQTRYRLGLLGKLQYLQTRMAWLQSVQSYQTALLGLTQAMETYYWDTEGLITIS